ncbi:ParB/RepB/Spo0J family partition protein [Bacteroidales bacterium OttesenSCG-928-K03]|nr:ParB/RepB/Spo0J family partition protein [Odoribacter sp. OttesenSCG-928-L07]MDL2242642.1 ParB/RepB/Spo0J family partition protein [Bacteroidales bacterium OttesenSCG-928-K03]
MANSNKKALGRGLGAILENPNTDITTKDMSGNLVVGAISEIEISLIETNPFQPRTEFEETALAELVNSIKEHGVIQPVTVRKIGNDKYQLISGGRRYKAATILKLATIPAYIRIANDEQMLEMALVENIQRKNLNPIEIALSYRRLIDECNLTQDDLSIKVSKDRSTISNFLRLLSLPDLVQSALKENKITIGHAKPLSAIDDEDSVVEFLRIILENNLSVRETERLISENKKTKTSKKSTSKVPQVMSVNMANFRQNFINKTGLNMKIKVGRNGKGSITIPFSSEKNIEEFMKLFEND